MDLCLGVMSIINFIFSAAFVYNLNTDNAAWIIFLRTNILQN
jgi:hypothetical protein